MLIRFSVANHQCFAAPVTIDLSHPDAPSTPCRLALIAGAGATGKSALMRSLGLLRSLTLAGPRAPLPIAAYPFSDLGPTQLRITVRQDGLDWHYELDVTPQQIVAERLATCPAGSEGAPRVLFSRTQSAPGRPPVIDLGSGDISASDQGRLRLVAQSTRPEQPFLHEALRRGAPLFLPLGIWLRDRLQLLLPEAKLVGLAARAARDPAFLAFLRSFLADAELGIADLRIHREPVPESYFQSREEQQDVIAALTQFSDSFADTPEGEMIADRIGGGPVVDIDRVRLLHSIAGPHGTLAELAADDLSGSACRLLHMAPIFYAAPPGSTAAPTPIACIDDFSHCLHPALQSALLTRFVRDRTLPADRQLIAFLSDSDLAGRLVRQAQAVQPPDDTQPVQLATLARSPAGNQLTVVV